MRNLILAIIAVGAASAHALAGEFSWRQEANGNLVVQSADGALREIAGTELRESAPVRALFDVERYQGYEYLIIQPEAKHIQSWEESAGQIGTLVVRDDLQWQRLPGYGYALDGNGGMDTPSWHFDLAEFKLSGAARSRLLDQWLEQTGQLPTREELRQAALPGAGKPSQACGKVYLKLVRRPSPRK